MKGKLIVIDGSDAAGKKTQTKLLVAYLKKEGYKVQTLDFPQYNSFFGSMVAEYLRGNLGGLGSVHPKLAALLYALDRFKQKEVLRKWLYEGDVVVLDRYIESNLAYSSAKVDPKEQQELIEWIENLEYGEFEIPMADLVVYLHVPTSVSAKLIKDRPKKDYLKGKTADIHEQDQSYQSKVVDQYLKLSKKKGWSVIDCTQNDELRSIDAISVLVCRVVTKFLET